jgi:cell division protein FtsW
MASTAARQGAGGLMGAERTERAERAERGAETSAPAQETPTRVGSRVRRGPIDVPLLAIALGLTTLGLVMIYSASSVVAENRFDDPSFFLSRQLIGVLAGLVALVVGLRLDYRWYRRLTYPILAVCVALLVLVLIPGIGVKVGFARRWLDIAGVRFQPAELAKIVAVFYLAYSVSKKQDKMRSFTLAFIPHLAVIGSMVLLLLGQPDFGSAAILMVTMGMMMFLGGARISYLVAFLIAGVVAAVDAIVGSEYRMERIAVFLNPEEHAMDGGWQITESLTAMGSGGISGLGLGHGHLKLGYIPELWNDFIATIIGHELGLIGLGVVSALFLVFLWRGTRIARHAVDPYGAYLAFGLTALVVLQAATNLCVAIGLLPTKGLTLPFVSYGRSSILISLFVVGVLLNISQRNPDLYEEQVALRREEQVRKRLDRRRENLKAARRALAGRMP